MEKLIFNRKMYLAIFTVFVFVFAVQMAEPTAAAKTKLIDKGSKLYSTDYGYVKFSWKTYKKGDNYVVGKGNYYYYSYNKNIKEDIYLKKVSKTKLKYTTIYRGTKYVVYKKTKLSAVKYYWKYVRP